MDLAPCGFISMRVDGSITNVNQTFCAWADTTADEARGRRLHDLLSAGSRLFFEAQIEPEILGRGSVREAALEVVRPDGSTVPVLANFVLHRSRLDEETRIHCTFFDISERKRFEADILAARRIAEESARGFQFLAHAGRELARSLEPDRTLKLAAELAVPRLADASVAYRMVDGQPVFISAMHRDGARTPILESVFRRMRPGHLRRFHDALTESGPVRLDQVSVDEEVRRALGVDERQRYEEMGLRHATVVPLSQRELPAGFLLLLRVEDERVYAERDPDPQGSLLSGFTQLVTIAFDNAHHHEAAQRAVDTWRSLEARFRNLFEVAPDALLFVDAQGRVLLANAEAGELFGRPRDALVGMNIARLARRQGHHGAGDVEPLLRGSSRQRVEAVAVRADGGEVPVELTVRPVHQEEGGRAIVNLHDVSERLALERERQEARVRMVELERLAEVDRFKTRFINMAAHELRTPLTPIQIHLGLLESAPASQEEPQRRSVAVLRRNTDRLYHLVEDLLLATRVQAHSLGVQVETVDLAGLVQHAVRKYRDKLREKRITLQMRVPRRVPFLVDRKHMLRAVDTLLSNAVKFTPEGGRIRVMLDEDDRGVTLRVQDNGIGIEPQVIPSLFEPFTQPGASEVTEPGTGLGLYIAQQIVALHGGSIGLNSAGPGYGAVAWVRLPWPTDEAPATDAAPTRQAGPTLEVRDRDRSSRAD